MLNMLYSPRLSNLIPLDKIPEDLHFLHSGLNSFLDNIYYRNLQVHGSLVGGTMYVYVELLCDQSLEATIPSTGFRLMLNPDYSTTSTITVIPLYFAFSWGILKYINGFDLTDFDLSPKTVYNLVGKVLTPSDEDLIVLTANKLLSAPQPFEQIADDINSTYGTNISLPTPYTQATAVDAIVAGIDTLTSTTIYEVIYDLYTKDATNSDASTFENIDKLFTAFVGIKPIEFIKDLITPFVYATVEVSAGLEIPRSLLVPMKLSNSSTPSNPQYEVETNTAVKTTLLFNAGEVFFDSNLGRIGFNDNIVLNFQAPYDQAQIGNTPLTLRFSNARFKFQKVSGSGSSAQFRTVISIDEIDIGLPAIFQQTNGGTAGPHIRGTNITIDSERGFSGTLALVPGNSGPNASVLQYSFVNGITLALNSFDVVFENGSVTSSNITGTIDIPNFSGSPFTVQMHLEDGFQLDILSSTGYNIVDNSNILITLNALYLGRHDTVWRIGFAAAIKSRREIPAISKVFPKEFIIHNLLYKTDGSQTLFDIEANWENGATLRGDQSTGLKAYFPIDLNRGFKLKGIQLNAKAAPNLEIEALLEGASLDIGPVNAKVDNLGARLTVVKDEANGNVGPFKTDFSIIGPRGIALKIKAGAIDGTGYLYFGDDEYIGALHLNLKNKIKLNAIGIINTRMPDGSKGFSLLVIITVEKALRIDIGLGFFITGVGGLLGLHRSMNTDVIRDGMRNGTLEHVLFPQIDPNNVDAIVNNIKQIFPVQKNQFVVGPMVRIAWGEADSPILLIDIGVLIELTNPFRIAIVGKITASVPDDTSKKIRINAAFIGVIDFDKQYLSFDAKIYDSRILTISLSGDIAVRVFWGRYKEFLVSVGGFHPAYNPPAYLRLPSRVERLVVALIDNNNFKLKLSTYFAVTSNTLQFGARIDLFYRFWEFEVKGYLGFDVLFRFNPFSFIANIQAGVSVFVGGRELMGVNLNFSLRGPQPWHATGYAEFEVLGISKKVEFDKSWGERPSPASIPQVAIQPLLQAAMQQSDNWQATLPGQKQTLVTLRPWPATKLVMHPLGRLNINQKVVPLGLEIQKYGTAIPSDGNTFDITQVRIASVAQSLSPLKDSFAPAQFRDMNDEDKLKAPSFEALKSGVEAVNAATDWLAEAFLVREVEHETIIVDRTETTRPGRLAMDSRLTYQFVDGGLINDNALAISARDARVAPSVKVAVRQEHYQVVTKDSLSPGIGAPVFSSEAEARNYQDGMGLLANFSLVVPKYYN